MASDQPETSQIRIKIRCELGLEKPPVFGASASRSLSWAIYCQRSKADFTYRIAAVSRVLNAIPPPPTLAETEDGPSRGPFFFWFQRGLVIVTALWRLPKQSKSVSEPHLSLIDRPRPPEGRFQNSVQLQTLGYFGRALFSKV